MVEKIEQAIEILASRIHNEMTADEALKFTQAALNLGHALGVLAHRDQK